MKRGPDGRKLFGSTCELLSSALSPYCGDRRGYSTRMRTCVFWPPLQACPGIASHRNASRYCNPGGRIAGGCVTGAAHVVGCAWHTPDVAESDDRSRAADGTVERIRKRGNEGGRGVPGLHKNMRRNFFGQLSVRSSLSVLCRPCSAHVASRASFGRCLRRLFLMSAFGSANMRWT